MLGVTDQVLEKLQAPGQAAGPPWRPLVSVAGLSHEGARDGPDRR
jgi:hypothetical protein